jgi:radical SAM superfamily enzyme YgiQ (UPF0313 family)
VVGGPWVTVQEDYFGDLADVIFVGEAEQTWPQFLLDWKAGHHQRRYEQRERTDMTTVPRPRLDLLHTDRYMFTTVQFSRGCPFQCEFCDIIVTFGRRPRIKTAAQVIAELEALLARGMRQVLIVDDNLIGHKKAIKEVLREVLEWQRARGYPMAFFTEVSIDLQSLHDRMPVILSPESFSAWFDPTSTQAELLDLLRPAPDEWLTFYTVDSRVGNVKNDDESLIEALD